MPRKKIIDHRFVLIDGGGAGCIEEGATRTHQPGEVGEDRPLGLSEAGDIVRLPPPLPLGVAADDAEPRAGASTRMRSNGGSSGARERCAASWRAVRIMPIPRCAAMSATSRSFSVERSPATNFAPVLHELGQVGRFFPPGAAQASRIRSPGRGDKRTPRAGTIRPVRRTALREAGELPYRQAGPEADCRRAHGWSGSHLCRRPSSGRGAPPGRCGGC